MAADGTIKNQVRLFRTRLGISQQELARSVGISRQTINAIEAGRESCTTGVGLRLARVLGCRVDDLFWLDDESHTVSASPAGGHQIEPGRPVSLARVGERWVAWSLTGAGAARVELVPGDGLTCATAADGQITARLLDDPARLQQTVVMAGCAPALSLWARAAERWNPGLRVHWIPANSTESLGMLGRDEIHVAGCHLFHSGSGAFNAPFVPSSVGTDGWTLVHLGRWDEGLAVRPGNPLGIREVADLARPGVRLINRELGAGARRLLDDSLSAAGVAADDILGYRRQVHSHWDVAAAIAAGDADVGVTAAGVARAHNLGFIPLRNVRYDMAVRTSRLAQDNVRRLFSTLGERWVRAQLAAVGGFDTAETGATTAVPGG